MIYLYGFLVFTNLLFVLFDSFVGWKTVNRIGWPIVFGCWLINICVTYQDFNGYIINSLFILLLAFKICCRTLTKTKIGEGE